DGGRAHAEGGVDPGPLGRVVEVLREVGDAGGAAGKAVEGGRDVGREAGRVELEVADDAVDVRVLQLQDLVEPMHELDVRVAAELAEDGGGLDRLVGGRVQLAEEGGTADSGHGSRRSRGLSG